MVEPAVKKQVVNYLKQAYHLSERRSCHLANISRSGYRYQPRVSEDEVLIKRLQVLCAKHPSYGYLFIHNILKTEGLVCNKKRTYRLYKALNLQVRTKKRKKLTRPRMPMVVPIEANIRWSMDFVSDQLANGRRFRVLNVIDDYSREVIGQLTAFSISGHQVSRFLNQLIEEREKPDQIICDNGSEFRSKAMYFWQQSTGVDLGFIQPGKPTQNAFVESLNGKFRAECLDQHWFTTIEQAEKIIHQWRQHYNYKRPHSSLNYLTPMAFVRKAG